MPHCKHCATAKELTQLCSIPLTSLSDGNLYNYVWHSVWTVGDSMDFRHFLPRVFEVMLCGDGSMGAEIVVGKLGYSDWRKWPRPEQAAVENFLMYWWTDLLSRYPALHMADSCLCSIALAIEDIQP